jgi:hypothetical protein|uniref:Uncharacterized protein n=1 Tax=Sphingobacterium sp. (strain 21) TaxID=743722 RepID=F4C8V1_SPHS2
MSFNVNLIQENPIEFKDLCFRYGFGVLITECEFWDI